MDGPESKFGVGATEGTGGTELKVGISSPRRIDTAFHGGRGLLLMGDPGGRPVGGRPQLAKSGGSNDPILARSRRPLRFGKPQRSSGSLT